MMATKYNKLVRDRIPEILRGKGAHPVIHEADGAEYWEKLKKKLGEEVAEFLEDESIEEVADVLEVLDAICAARGFTSEEVQRVKEKKAKERGHFEKRIILEEA